MNSSEDERNHLQVLRSRAEELLQGKQVDLEDLSSTDIHYLFHELQVYQAELTIQNEELRRVQLELEASRDRYSNLYNFAPAGYCTIDQKDRVLEANQTLSELLAVDHKKIIHSTFSQYVLREDRDKYYLFRRRALERKKDQVCELFLARSFGEPIAARLEARRDLEDSGRLMVMLTDITRQREFRNMMVEQREKERKRLASDLHDGPVQALAAITFDIRSLMLDHPDQPFTPALEKIQESLREQIRILRNFSAELRPPLLKHLGLEKAMRSYLENFRAAHPQFDLKISLPTMTVPIAESTAIALFRIFQEALTNISKHARMSATKVNIRLENAGAYVHLEVQDNGSGFAPPEQWIDFVHDGHLGLLGMYEWAESLGGQVEIQSHPGAGTKIHVKMPVRQDETD
jgi:PAS domain S-box-containing protein